MELVNNSVADEICFIIFALLRMMSNGDTYYRNAEGNFFLTKDVAALGDCAVLAVLCHPKFHSPFTDVQDLWRTVVNFARTVASEDCATVYSVLRSVAVCPFQVYLEQMLQPRFWVGTEFFVMVTMLYGVEVRVHFLDNHKNPQVESTVLFMQFSSK